MGYFINTTKYFELYDPISKMIKQWLRLGLYDFSDFKEIRCLVDDLEKIRRRYISGRTKLIDLSIDSLARDKPLFNGMRNQLIPNMEHGFWRLNTIDDLHILSFKKVAELRNFGPAKINYLNYILKTATDRRLRGYSQKMEQDYLNKKKYD